MLLAADARTRTQRLASRSPIQIARDLATLVGAALTVGVAAGIGMMLTVLLLA